jgi:hypothetical protein
VLILFKDTEKLPFLTDYFWLNAAAGALFKTFCTLLERACTTPAVTVTFGALKTPLSYGKPA